MVELSPAAERQINELIAHYELKERVEAAENLLRALEAAKFRIAQAPEAVLEAPRPYPGLKRRGRRWLLEGSYWISYSLAQPPRISGVFFAAADIPNRA